MKHRSRNQRGGASIEFTELEAGDYTVEAEAWDSGNDELVASGSKDIKVEADKTTECSFTLIISNCFVAEDGSIAMRITKEPFSKELCYRFQKPVVSTSANISGEPAAQNYCDIAPELLEAVDYVCWSRRQEHKPHTPSSIIKITNDGVVTIIRK